MGPWIKIETHTPDKPEMFQIARSLGIPRPHACGICVDFWAWCDANLTEGFMSGFHMEDIDKIVDHVGFGSAMVSCGWLQIEDGGIRVTNFHRHFGVGRKARDSATQRQKKNRAMKRKSTT